MRWVVFGLVVALALPGSVVGAWRASAPGRRRWLAVHRAVFVVLAGVEIAVYLLSGRGLFWPAWSIPIIGIPLAVHTWAIDRPPGRRERELIARVERLVRTRSGALDAQAQELRRIERDLHDGAQARLVSIGMTLGLAESLLRTDPDTAATLLAEARGGTKTALADLRTVMQSVYPPVLADRGLAGALQALALDLAVPTRVSGGIPGAAPPAIESAVYFAVAECLANVVKHARARRADVDLGYGNGRLTATVTDDGRGGATIGDGTGLRGVVHRLEAFDGIIDVVSPPGGPTSIRLEVPCELSSPRTSPSSGTA
jgi:signal transduction histidine kinase